MNDKLTTHLGYNNLNYDKNLKNKYILQFLPKSLEIFSENEFFNYNKKRLKTSYIMDIIHNLIFRYFLKKVNKFCLYSVILKEKYGSLYNHYINFLLEKKILILVSNYKKGRNSRIYSLNDGLLIDIIKRYKNKDKTLLKKYKNRMFPLDEENISNINNNVKVKLIKDIYKVKIDYDYALSYLEFFKEDNINNYNNNKYSIDCIENNQFFYHFDRYGRLHTNFTILKSFIRKNCLRIDNEETFEIDIKNSQPLFLCKLIENTNTSWIKKEEFKFYKELSINGNFYEYFMNYYKINDKEIIKEMIYKVFFGKNLNSKSDKLFRNLFPSVYNFIKLYKKELKDYKCVSHELQRLESDFIFNKVIKKIIENYPEITIFTVHDSIVIKKSKKNEVLNIFNDCFDLEFSIDDI